jgi:hypothetical protein
VCSRADARAGKFDKAAAVKQKIHDTIVPAAIRPSQRMAAFD